MAQLQRTLDAERLQDLFSYHDPMRLLLQKALDQVHDAEMTEHVGAERYEQASPVEVEG